MKTAHRVMREALHTQDYSAWAAYATPEVLANLYSADLDGELLTHPVFLIAAVVPLATLNEGQQNYWIRVRDDYMKRAGMQTATTVVEFPKKMGHKSRSSFNKPLNGDTLSHVEKQAKVLRGEYFCQVPPVSTTMWTVNDWVEHITKTGGWK